MEYSLLSAVGALVTNSLYALSPSNPFPSKVFLSGLKVANPALYNIIIGMSVVTFWYGGWGLLDIYLPGGKPVKYGMAFIIGLVMLVLTQSWSEF